LKDREIIIGIIAAILLFSLALFGFSGLRTIGGVIVFFFVPFYLILDNFKIESGEKIVFAFFIGLGLFSAVVYYLGIFMSLRLAAGIVFVVLSGAGFLIKKIKS